MTRAIKVLHDCEGISHHVRQFLVLEREVVCRDDASEETSNVKILTIENISRSVYFIVDIFSKQKYLVNFIIKEY